jgi:hypothetical protein
MTTDDEFFSVTEEADTYSKGGVDYIVECNYLDGETTVSEENYIKIVNFIKSLKEIAVDE